MSQPRARIGVALVLVGVIFLLDALAVVDLWATSGGWWPVLLVVLGGLMLRRDPPEAAESRSGSAVSLLAARKVEVRRRSYRGGRVWALLGHTDFDLRRATLHKSGAKVSVLAVIGDVSITVPPGWRVRVGPRLIVADLDADLLPASADTPLLEVGGLALLSDVRVRTGSFVT